MSDELFLDVGALSLDDTTSQPNVDLSGQAVQNLVVPRYLFRLFTPCSDGSTDQEWVKSRDAVKGLHRADIRLRHDVRDAATELQRHLRWNHDLNQRDNLVSWTSSLLVAGQYAIYRHKSSKDASRMDDINIMIVDTELLPPGSFLRDLDLIEQFLDHDAELEKLYQWRTGRLYFGEFLSQGLLSVRGKCCVVSVQALIEHGLFKLQPELQTLLNASENTWANAVVQMRQKYHGPKLTMTIPYAITTNVVEQALLFTPTFRLAMVAYLIGLMTARYSKIAIERIMYRPELKGLHKGALAPQKNTLFVNTMEELRRTKEVMCAMHAIYVEHCIFDTQLNLVKAQGKLNELLEATDGLQRDDISLSNTSPLRMEDTLSCSKKVVELCEKWNKVLLPLCL